MTNASRTDILVNRICSADEQADDFAEFTAAASSEHWQRLARALRDEMHMRSALGAALDNAGRNEINRAHRPRYAASGGSRLRIHSWSGWAVAAVVALAWTLTIVMTGGDARPAGHQVHPTSGGVQFASLTTDEALEQYLRAGQSEGRVIRELPAMLVESYQMADGGLEVFYVRQFLERDEVGRVYEMAADEHGRAVPVEINPASLVSTSTSM